MTTSLLLLPGVVVAAFLLFATTPLERFIGLRGPIPGRSPSDIDLVPVVVSDTPVAAPASYRREEAPCTSAWEPSC
jgi:hypothetical protein